MPIELLFRCTVAATPPAVHLADVIRSSRVVPSTSLLSSWFENACLMKLFSNHRGLRVNRAIQLPSSGAQTFQQFGSGFTPTLQLRASIRAFPGTPFALYS